MRRRQMSGLTLVLAAVAGLLLASGVDAEGKPSDAKLGKKIDNVAFKDAAGKTTSLHDLKDKKAIVVIFLSFDCPVSASYSQPLADLAKTYGSKGVAFLGVACTDDDAAKLAKQLKDFNIPFPVYKDEKFAGVDAFKAEFTPEAFVLDGDFVLRYRGRIDDAYAARLKKNQQVTRHDLRQALDEMLAAKPIGEPVTQAVGCPIQRDAKAKTVRTEVTYHRDVLPILQNRCQGCHRPGEVGPFSLMTYKQAVSWAEDIKEYTQSRKMPPWKPSDGLEFMNERKLPDKEIATLAKWVDGGTPEGNPKDAPPPKKFTDGWQLGKPDLILSMPDDYQLGPTGNDIFRCMVLPTNLDEDKYVTAIEVRPGNARILHHCLIFIDTSGQARKLEQKEKDRKVGDDEVDRGPGYSASMGVGFFPKGGLGGWAPGQVPRYLPEGTGHLLPKGADVVVQMHYHRDGRIEKDRTSFGLYFAKKPVEKAFQALVIPGRFLIIPKNEADFKVNGTVWVTSDCTVHNIMPHMHLLGKDVSVTMTPPEGEKQLLVAIKEWDYNWQETYIFKEPLKVTAGTRFDVVAHFDNSAKNANNPHKPPKDVRFGEQTTDEMLFVFMGATSEKKGRIGFSFLGPPKKNEEKK